MAIFLCHMSKFRTIFIRVKRPDQIFIHVLFSNNNMTWMSESNEKCKWPVWGFFFFVLLLAHRISGLSASYLKEKACTGFIIFFPLPRAAPRPPNTSSYRHRLKTLSHYITWPWRYLETTYGGVLSKYSHKSGGVTLPQHGYKYSIKALLACSLFTAKKFAAYFTDQPALQ